MSEGEFVLAGKHVRHGQDNPTDTDLYDCRDFEQPCADCAAGRRLQRHKIIVMQDQTLKKSIKP